MFALRSLLRNVEDSERVAEQRYDCTGVINDDLIVGANFLGADEYEVTHVFLGVVLFDEGRQLDNFAALAVLIDGNHGNVNAFAFWPELVLAEVHGAAPG